ncbi:MAG: Hsp33 family molecular chaperone HslO [Acholeplasmatales bacterium]|nr:Hsp33 family molecular chaperone HslO [Acholeplasmatales bacterium]
MDTLAKALAYDKQIRIYACVTTELVAEAQKRHGLWPSSSAALGRTMTASLLTAVLKEENVTVKINGGGPIKDIVVEATKYGTVRGYVGDPYQFYQYNDSGKINVSYAVGTDGLLEVKTLINNEVFTSSSPLQTGEIADDFTYYFASSEQIPSSVGLGVLVNDDNTILASGGFIIQVLPNCSDEVITELENKLKNIKEVSTMVKDGYTPEDIIKELVGENNYELLDSNMPLKWYCRCSKDNFRRGLKMLKVSDLEDLIKDESIETVCNFCNTKYIFTKDELVEILNEKQNNKQ